ncbi:MAG: hypothetical protein AAB478_00555 [Patescibacteria group bacterium]
MATSYTTKLSSDEMFEELRNNPGFAYEVSQTWSLVKNLLKKRKEFNGVNLKKITEPQWQEIYASITKDEKDRRLFNPIITNRNRPAIDDSEIWLYGPISEDAKIQQIVLDYTSKINQTSPTAEEHTISHSAQPETPAQPVFAEQAKKELEASQHPTQPAPIAPEDIKAKAAQLEQHAKTAQNMQEIQANATNTPSQGDNRPALAGNSNSKFAAFDQKAQDIKSTTSHITPLRPMPLPATLGYEIEEESNNEEDEEEDRRRRRLREDRRPSERTTQGEAPETPRAPSEPSPAGERPMRPSPQRVGGRLGSRLLPRIPRLGGGGSGVRGAAQGARGAAQAARGIATLARAAPLLANPYVLAAMGIAAIILLVVVLLVKPGEGGDANIKLETAQTTVDSPPPDCQGDAQAQECANQVDAPSSPSGPVLGSLGTVIAQSGQSVLGIKDTPRVLGLNGYSPEQLKKLIAELTKHIITYQIHVSYDGQADDIRVTYPIIPSEAAFVSATGLCHLTKDGQGRVTLVEWSVKENQNTSQAEFTKCTLGTTPTPTLTPTPTPTPTPEKGVRGTSTQKIVFSTYTQAPYYLPSPGTSDTQYSTTTIHYLNDLGARVARHQAYLIGKTRGARYVDPFLSVIWTGAIEGIGDNPYFWNCQDRSHDINAGCAGGFYSGGWQVGYGMQVSQAVGHLGEDFDEAYGANTSNNAQKTQQVGQGVIAASNGLIRNPSVFPSKSVRQLASEVSQGNATAQQAIAILLMDKELGAIAMAREVAGDIAAKDNWASTMRSWGSYYGDNMQNFSNRAKAIADRYTGSSSSDPNPPGISTGKASFSPITFQIKILPIKKDFAFTSQPASADVIGGVGGDNTIGGNTSDDSSSDTSGTINIGSNPPPNTSNCSGAYVLNGGQHDGNNFGDPDCELAQSQRISYDFNGRHWSNVPKAMVDLLKQLDPAGVGYWIGISACEAPGFDPNNVSVAVNGSAYGLFQMGSRFVNGQESPFGEGVGLNGQYDRGDVNWKTQVSNAVNYHLKNLGGGWGYWECAKIVWGL